MREVRTSFNDLDIDELFFYLEEKVRSNTDTNIEAELYEEIMMIGEIHNKYKKIIRKLQNEMKLIEVDY